MDPFDIFDSHQSPLVHLRPLTAEGQWEALKELARAEDAANEGIPHSSSTSHEITSLRAVHSKASSTQPEATADDPLDSTAQLRVARTEEILGSDSVRLCRAMGVYQQVEDQILLID